MKRVWKFNFDIKLDDGGGNAGTYEIKAWTAGDAIRTVVEYLKKTSKDDQAKKIKSLAFSLTRKE